MKSATFFVAILAAAAVSFGLGTLRRPAVVIAENSSAPAIKGFERSANSTVSIVPDKENGNENGIKASVVNRRFTVAHFYTGNDVTQERFRTLLLQEELKSTRVVPSEGAESVVSVEGWSGRDADVNEKLWTITAEGDEGGIWDRFYQITRYGCCGSEATQTMFNIESGQRVYTTTLPKDGGLFKIEIPNTSNDLVRFVGYQSNVSSLRPLEADTIKGFAGYIQYGSESRLLQKVVVKHFGPDKETGTPEIKTLYRQKISSTSPLELWGVDKQNNSKAIGAFSLILSYGRAINITIPVVADHLDIERATVPRGFAVEPVR